METKLARWNQRLQIGAILVAGIWAIWTFSINVLPKMGTNFGGKLTLDSRWSPERSACLYTIGMALTNKSSLNQKVEKVEYHGTWATLPKTPADGDFVLIEFDPDRTSESLLNKNRERESPLLGTYAPGGTSEDGFEILTGPTPDEVLFVQVTLFSKDEEIDFFYEWIESCTPPNKANASEAKNSSAD